MGSVLVKERIELCISIGKMIGIEVRKVVGFVSSEPIATAGSIEVYLRIFKLLIST